MSKYYSRNISLALLSLTPLVLASVLVLSATDTTASRPSPPVAKKIPKITEINGHEFVDNYYWLRDKQNPDVRAYLEAENVYTDAVMKPTEPLQKKLYDEMLSHIKETDVEVPYRFGDYFYYSRTEAGKQYPIRCRRKGSMDAPEEVVLDLNELGKGQAFISLGAYEVSDDGTLSPTPPTTPASANTRYLSRISAQARTSRNTRSALAQSLGQTTTKPFSTPSKILSQSVNISCIAILSLPLPLTISLRREGRTI